MAKQSMRDRFHAGNGSYKPMEMDQDLSGKDMRDEYDAGNESGQSMDKSKKSQSLPKASPKKTMRGLGDNSSDGSSG